MLSDSCRGKLTSVSGIVEYSIVFLTLVGLVALRLRRKIPNDGLVPPRYRVPWVLIAVASLMTTFILCVSVTRHPFSGLSYLAFSAASVVMYRNVVVG